MSAITGIYHFNKEPVNIEQGNNLMKALQKYPADDVQTWYKDHIFLGCHAQWITPESVGEQLPYYDRKRKLAITADAIIDNRDELFNQLHIDHSFRKTMTDSELILRSYHKWGDDCPKYLIGDFAFVIWDERNSKLFGARDFSGSRTLYFYRDNQRFVFCTTIEPFFTLPYIEKKLNDQWLAEFLVIPQMFDSLDAVSTVYKSLEQVPASHSITIAGGKVSFSKFCSFNNIKRLKLKSNEDYIEAFREVFEDAVAARLRTHKNVGSFLSGGLDSSSVVSFAARMLSKENKTLNTFTQVPPDDFVDWTAKKFVANETPFVKSTVEYVGNINSYYLDFAGKSPLTEIDSWLNIMEMPYKFFENSYWLNGIFEKASEQGIGILLNAAKGNFTISWGPAYSYFALLLKRLSWMRLYHEATLFCKNTGMGRRQAIHYIGKIAFPLLDKVFRSTEPYQFPRYINPDLAQQTRVFDKLKEHRINLSDETVNVYEERIKHFEEVSFHNLAGTVTSKLSLCYSMWNRDPTNDLRIVNFCLAVPENQYVQNGLDRALIRRLTKNYLPDKVRLNQTVQGIQGVDWVHRMAVSWKEFVEELQQLCLDPIAIKYFDLPILKAAISKVQTGPRPEYSLDPEYRTLMRCLIFYRFIKNV